ncbi:hypothetical protein [Pedobacter jamesrossensis]|uniref:DKNYY family protein n=1 Tax=Pedobacter jamesrossensis TaxID=1908238 RepID=A0ABV8NJS3_9SPHI
MKNFKRYVSLLILMLLSINLMAQKENITGVYKRSSGNPEGGTTYFVMENKKFVVAFFGGVLVGNWSVNGDVVTFTPDVDAQHFYIYGRHNNDLKNETRVYFQRFEENSTFIGLGQKQNEKPILKRVFNPSPNCVKYPSVTKFDGFFEQISFSDQSSDFNDKQSNPNAKRNIYTFDNKEKFNDFVAFYNPDDRAKRPFYAKIKDGKLFFKYDEDKGSVKYPLPTKGENFEFITQIVNAPRSTDKVFYNPFYSSSKENVSDKLNWKFDDKKNAYVNLFNYTEGEEYKPDTDDAYNKKNIIYQFNILPLKNKAIIPFAIDSKPLFTENCNN